MKRPPIFLACATVAFAAGLGLAAPAAAGHSGDSAQDQVDRLQVQGYEVIVTRLGTGSLEHCSVAEVRPGRDVHGIVSTWESPLAGGTVQAVLHTTIYVDAQC